MKTIKILFLSTLLATALISCGDDDDGIPVLINEEEVITTVNLTLTPTDSSNPTVLLSSVDSDGEGPDSPVITVSGNLVANATYTGSVSFLNETESPAEDITVEVEEEDDEHQVFYTTSSSLSITTTYSNFDGDGNPLGTLISLNAGDAGTGTYTVTLRHEPMKPNDGSLNDAGGETDVQVIFPITVE